MDLGAEATDQAPIASVRLDQIRAQLDRRMPGNEVAKAYLASILFKHLVLLASGSRNGSKSHTLVLGPTGVGKSYLVNALREITQVPLVSIDATTLTEIGYHGRDVDTIFEQLLRESGLDRNKAESGIVFIDEFDKLKASLGSERDIRGIGVQYSFLKILDGDIRHLPGQRTSRLQTAQIADTQPFDTSRLLFIFSGAFSANSELMSVDRVRLEDLCRVGFLEELIARIPNIIRIQRPDERTVAMTLEHTKDGVLKEYSEVFNALGCVVEFTPAARRQIAEEVLDMAMGYRGIRAVLDRLLLPKLGYFMQTVEGKLLHHYCIDYQKSEFVINSMVSQ